MVRRGLPPPSVVGGPVGATATYTHKGQLVYSPLNFDKMLTLGHHQASLHGSRLIAFFDKMLTLGHQQASLHGSRLIAFLAASRQKNEKLRVSFCFALNLHYVEGWRPRN